MLLEVSDSRHRLPLAEKGAFSPGGFQGNLLAEKSVLSWPFLFLNGNLALLEYSLFFPGGGRTSLTLVVGFKFPPVSLPKGHPKATFGGVTSLWPFSPKEIPLGCVFCETPPPPFLVVSTGNQKEQPFWGVFQQRRAHFPGCGQEKRGSRSRSGAKSSTSVSRRSSAFGLVPRVCCFFDGGGGASPNPMCGMCTPGLQSEFLIPRNSEALFLLSVFGKAGCRVLLWGYF